MCRLAARTRTVSGRPGGLALEFPDTEAGPVVFVGDGRSDFCASGRADILFAKASLADYAAQRGLAFHPFEDFHDVTARLAPMVEARAAAVG